MSQEKLFPIQNQRDQPPYPRRIPWAIAERAYSVYAGRYGNSQSLERLAERGGFGPIEMDAFLPGWRDECNELLNLRRVLRNLFEAMRAQLAKLGQPDEWTDDSPMGKAAALLAENEPILPPYEA